MGAIPAKVAGVNNIAMVSPPTKSGVINPHLLVAAKKVGVDAVYKVGSAWAIAAMAYGTESVPKVDKIFGPGNAWVTAAKQIVAADALDRFESATSEAAAGCAAARAALGLGAQVTLLDDSVAHLRTAAAGLAGGVTTMLSTPPNVEKALSFADLVLGAVAVRGQRPPILVTRDMLRLMKPRSLLMDLAIDMGGCFETSRPTSLTSPTYEVDGILHVCIPNLPSGAARTATQALTNALLPYLITVADQGLDAALHCHPDLARGTYLYRGRCASEVLARTFDVDWWRLPALEE